jgi:ribonuclease-3
VWKKAITFIRSLRGLPEAPASADLPDADRTSLLRELELRINYRFKDPSLLDRALTHRSWAHEHNGVSSGHHGDYEALEFLGDAILGFVVAEFLYLTYGNLTEGHFTKIRGHLVSTRQLAKVSSNLDLGRYLKLSKGEDKTGGRLKPAILADLFESVVAAIYLDGELDTARDFILAQFRDSFSALARGEIVHVDSKSSLQERLHQQGRPTPHYVITRETGPEHDKRYFVAVMSGSAELARGSGRSKKEAEQEAAAKAVAGLASPQAGSVSRPNEPDASERPVLGDHETKVQ